jgi:hypothetical protein
MNILFMRDPASKLREKSIEWMSQCFSLTCIGLMPLMPLLMSVLFLDSKYIKQYQYWLGKFRVHFAAIAKGPVTHYLSDVFLHYQDIPVHIQGECVQCGNCCLDKQCAFLEPIENDKFQCGIYHSRLRRYSNCNSFPLNAKDIERYQCPSYFVVNIVPVRTSR